MRPVSDRFRETVKESHRTISEAHLYDPDGSYVTQIEVVDGSVTIDESSVVRSSCDLALAGDEWVPRDPQDRLAPYGSEINVRKGVQFPNGATEMVSLGWFGIEDLEMSEDGSGVSVRVTGMDRMRRFQYAPIENDVTFPGNTPFLEIILSMATEAWPDVPVADDFLSVSTLSYGDATYALMGEDRAEDIQSLAQDAGVAVYFAGDGKLTARPYADADPVAEVTEGEGGVLVSASRTWSRANAFNRVIVTGEDTGSGTVPRGVATDDNPDSPTYYFGPFGHAPRFYSHQRITDDEHATHVAATILAKEAGTPYSVNFGMVPNPALEPGDSVTVKRPAVGIKEQHVISNLSIGLGSEGSMSCSTRQRFFVSI